MAISVTMITTTTIGSIPVVVVKSGAFLQKIDIYFTKFLVIYFSTEDAANIM